MLPLIIGNWKMNGLHKAGSLLAESIAIHRTQDIEKSTLDVVLCPPFTLTAVIMAKLSGSNVKLGAQDCHHESFGAYTGSISAPMLKELGCDYIIVGHSERRTLEHETNALVKAKAEAAHRAGAKAVICIGETLAEREANQALHVIEEQLAGSLPDSATPENTIIAYEPVWAIGTGKVASLSQIEEMHRTIKSFTQARSMLSGILFSVLYGGSVKADNAHEVLAICGVDGALVGGASLKIEEFLSIIQSAEAVYAKKNSQEARN